MKRKVEMLLQLGTLCLFLIVAFAFSWHPVYGIRVEEFLGILVLGIFTLFIHNIILSTHWWIEKYRQDNPDKRFQSLTRRFILIILPLFLVLLVGPVIRREYKSIEKVKEWKIALNESEETKDYEISLVGDMNVLEEAIGSGIEEIIPDGDDATITFNNGVAVIGCMHPRRNKISLVIMSEPVAGGDAAR